MSQNCTGIPIMAYPNKPTACQRHDCRNKTNWYCKGCKRWLCMNRNKSKTNANNKDQLYETSVRRKKVTFVKSCFHAQHENAWCHMTEKNIELDLLIILYANALIYKESSISKMRFNLSNIATWNYPCAHNDRLTRI
jgi:hypothetical protein